MSAVSLSIRMRASYASALCSACLLLTLWMNRSATTISSTSSWESSTFMGGNLSLVESTLQRKEGLDNRNMGVGA